MESYRISGTDAISSELIQSLVLRYKTKEVPRLKRLQNYYVGNPDIKNRKMNDPSKPNNKLANPFASHIINQITGYFISVPISYVSEDKELMEEVQAIHDLNHESAHNSKLVKELSITGSAYELLYMNESKEVKLALLNPTEVFMIFDNSIEKNAIAAVRTFDVQDYVTDDVSTQIEVYTDSTIRYATLTGTNFKWHNELETNHYFGKLPVIQYLNNDEGTGAFEKIIDLINAYDMAVSDSSNNFEYFSDSYLVLTGMEDTNPEELKNMKEQRIMLLSENGRAEWLIKNSSNMEIEEYKDRLKEDIYTLSNIPNMSDESFGSATSGESLKYKLLGLENLVSITERNFTESIENRLELITNILNFKGKSYSYNEIGLTYTRNIPSNISTTVDTVSKLSGLISQETLLSQLPFISDPAWEISKMKAETDNQQYGDFFPSSEAEAV